MSARNSNRAPRRQVASRQPARMSNISQKVSHVSHQVNKVTPFVVRKGRQLLTPPSHRESGLNLERFFRHSLTPSNAAVVSVSRAQLASLVLEELGIASTTLPLDLTVKEIRAYASVPLDMQVFYRTGDQADRSTTFSDYAAQGGTASIEVVLPVASRDVFTSDSVATDPVVSVRTPNNGSAPLQPNNYLIIDYLVRVTSREAPFEPTVSNQDEQPDLRSWNDQVTESLQDLSLHTSICGGRKVMKTPMTPPVKRS